MTAKNVESRSDGFGLTTVLLALVLAPTCFSHFADNATAWRGYYPLAVGNTWEYSGSTLKGRAKGNIIGRVVNKTSNRNGEIFAVWPAHRETDDEGMQLQFTNRGLVEVTGDYYLLEFPIVKANRWEAGPTRSFYVINEGNPCASGKQSFKRCAVIQDDDSELGLRTITTYAFGIGPVKYEYFAVNGREAEARPKQTLTIQSYSLK